MYFLGEAQPVPEKIRPGFDSITAKDAETYLKFLSSDLMEGRDTGTSTYDIAAEFAAALYRLWDIKPAGDYPPRVRSRIFEKSKKRKKKKERTYFQKVIMKKILDKKSSIILKKQYGNSVESKTFHLKTDYMDNTTIRGGFQKISAPAVFVGYGISEKSLNFDEYKGVDIKGKVVIMFSGTPQMGEDSPFMKGKLKEKYYPGLKQIRKDGWANPKFKLLTEKGALAVLEISTSDESDAVAKAVLRWKQLDDQEPIGKHDRLRLTLNDDSPYWSWDYIPRFWISKTMAKQILGIDGNQENTKGLENLAKQIGESLKPQSRELKGVFITIDNQYKTEIVSSQNVIAFIEGSHPELKNEVVIVGAHLDHIGRKGDYIYNGANDNASGSAGVLELAQAFSQNPVIPKRSILFALWTGEEQGMLGSRYYVENSYFPLDKTVAYLNMDMIGWLWEDKEIMASLFKRRGQEIPAEILEKIDLANFIMPGVADTSPEVFEAFRNCGCYVGGVLYLRKGGGQVGGSDYVPFARKKVPWAHLVTGSGKYTHHPGDSIDKIDFPLIQKISRYVYTIVFTLADQ